jgi:curved DNA-binding protein CbpA
MSDDFRQRKYNLYELLNVNQNDSTEKINHNFRQIIKKFHPDKGKLSPLEEELYYEITLAKHILSDPDKRYNYDNYLNIKNSTQKKSESNYGSIKQQNSVYFPDTKEEAFKSYLKQSNDLYKRHGDVHVPKAKLSTLIREKSKERENMRPIIKEHFKGSDDFNNVFINRKNGGEYSNNIINYEGGNIIPFELGKSSLNLTSLKDFHNMYTNDTVRERDMTSLSQAFLLQPHKDIDEDFDYEEKISDYQNNIDPNNNFNF